MLKNIYYLVIISFTYLFVCCVIPSLTSGGLLGGALEYLQCYKYSRALVVLLLFLLLLFSRWLYCCGGAMS